MIRCEECQCVADDADEGWVTYLIAEDEEQPDLIPSSGVHVTVGVKRRPGSRRDS